MINKYMRLFAAQTKLMTAEKMRLDRFCEHGDYLAYRISLQPHAPLNDSDVDIEFVFEVDLGQATYSFTNDNIIEQEFFAFELNLTMYLNRLFKRKQEFEKRNEMFKEVMQKLTTDLTEEERQCLATNIDANTPNVLKALGVASEE